jgi:hypothetical protein
MSWLLDLMHTVTRTESVDFVIRGPLGLGGAPPVTAELQAGECYVSVKVASLRLPYTRQKVVEKLYGVVHAFADLPSSVGQNIQFAAATMPSKLAGVDPKNLQNVLTIDKIVVGPTPWSGGALNLQIGLFSVVSENLAGPFLETITKLTETIGVSFAASARPYVDTLRFGVEALTRATGSVKLEIGLDQTFEPLSSGDFVLVAESVGKLQGKSMTLDPSDRKLLVDGQHYTDKPYLGFSVIGSAQRSNWGEIPELKATYATIREGVMTPDQNKARGGFDAFRRAALFSPDLTRSDAKQLVEKVQALLNTAFEAAGTSRALTSFPELHQVGLYEANGG